MQSRFGSFALVAVLLLLGGCGKASPSSVQAQSGSSFSNATRTGTYAIALSGTQGLANGQIAEFDIMANVVATGTGQLSGTYSEFINYLENGTGSNPTGSCTGTITSGTYSVNGSGGGNVNVTFAPSSTQSCLTYKPNFTIATNPTGSMIVLAEMDGADSVAGTGILQ
jgi:Flp pilus assembly protein TadG